MPIETVDDLLNIIQRVGLFGPDQLEEVAQQVVPHYSDAISLADFLIEMDWLTEFQVQTLFDGNPSDLVLGPYQLLSRLGEGGVSTVFKAWDSERGRVVALKVLRQDVISTREAIRQFNRELQAVTRLSHPNIIKTHDAAQLDNLHYFAMEFVEGTDLLKFVDQSGPLPVDQACDYIRQVAQGLQHAHQLGLVHRDIKPANLFLINPPVQGKQLAPGMTPPRRGPDPVVKILDWGLARIKPAEGESLDLHAYYLESEKGQLIGTADYVAPEQARDPSLVDTRADIYSLGCTFYYLLTGNPPFPGKTLMQKLMMHQEAEPPSVLEVRPDVPPELDGILSKMMAKNVEDRFQIPLLVVAALRHFCPGAFAVSGSVIRPSSSSNLGTTLRPTSSPNLASAASAARPASSANLGSLRPSSSSNLGSLRLNGASGANLRPGTSPNLPNPHAGKNGEQRNGH